MIGVIVIIVSAQIQFRVPDARVFAFFGGGVLYGLVWFFNTGFYYVPPDVPELRDLPASVS